MYGQNLEDIFVKKLFDNNMPGYKGTLLSVGENDGITLSNSRLFIENGWSAVLVEPSHVCFGKLQELYKDNHKVKLLNCCVGLLNAVEVFHESSQLLGSGDYGLVSTMVESEKHRWNKTTTFKQTLVQAITVNELLKRSNASSFDYVTIDTEGMDLAIFGQLDLTLLDCKVVVVEWNGKNKKEFDDIANKHSFKLKHKNAENLIYSIW